MLPPLKDLEVEVEALSRLLGDPQNTPIRLIDCREQDEFSFCHIEGAELIPLSCFGEQVPVRLLEPSQDIVVYCHHGMRSMSAVLHLRMKGFHQSWSLRGGIDAWAERIDSAVPRY